MYTLNLISDSFLSHKCDVLWSTLCKYLKLVQRSSYILILMQINIRPDVSIITYHYVNTPYLLRLGEEI